MRIGTVTAVRNSERGVGMLEYALVLAILVLALLASINGISVAVEKRGTISQEVNVGELGTTKYTMVPCDTSGSGLSLSEECY